MSNVTPQGWGGGRWGLTPWGGTDVEELRLIGAIAVRENVLRLEFNQAPIFTGILDPFDASQPKRYSINAIAGTFGLDSFATRPVRVLMAEQAKIANSGGRFIDLYVDRPFSPFPAQYRATANNIYSSDQAAIEPGFTSQLFFGLKRLYIPSEPERAVTSRDIANPQTLTAALDPLPEVTDLVLGTFPVDEGGDYAADEGISNLKKRVFRRLFTRKGAFAHMPEYGIGIQTYSKKLNTFSTRQLLIAEIEKQLSQEPDIARMRAVAIQRAPGLVVFAILIRTVIGTGVKFEAPVSVG